MSENAFLAKSSGSQRINVGHSHCSNRCWVSLCFVSFSRLMSVLCNKVSILVVLLKMCSMCLFLQDTFSGASQTGCTHLFKVLIVMALCEAKVKQ